MFRSLSKKTKPEQRWNLSSKPASRRKNIKSYHCEEHIVRNEGACEIEIYSSSPPSSRQDSDKRAFVAQVFNEEFSRVIVHAYALGEVNNLKKDLVSDRRITRYMKLSGTVWTDE